MQDVQQQCNVKPPRHRFEVEILRPDFQRILHVKQRSGFLDEGCVLDTAFVAGHPSSARPQRLEQKEPGVTADIEHIAVAKPDLGFHVGQALDFVLVAYFHIDVTQQFRHWVR
ncbi:hypothetical protein D9M71_423060 [compost metagenome]